MKVSRCNFSNRHSKNPDCLISIFVLLNKIKNKTDLWFISFFSWRNLFKTFSCKTKSSSLAFKNAAQVTSKLYVTKISAPPQKKKKKKTQKLDFFFFFLGGGGGLFFFLDKFVNFWICLSDIKNLGDTRVLSGHIRPHGNFFLGGAMRSPKTVTVFFGKKTLLKVVKIFT